MGLTLFRETGIGPDLDETLVASRARPRKLVHIFTVVPNVALEALVPIGNDSRPARRACIYYRLLHTAPATSVVSRP